MRLEFEEGKLEGGGRGIGGEEGVEQCSDLGGGRGSQNKGFLVENCLRKGLIGDDLVAFFRGENERGGEVSDVEG